MASYRYTIFDANPSNSSGTAWPTHEDIEIECDSDEDAIDEVRSVMQVEAAGLNPSDGYEIGDTLHSIVWDGEGIHLTGCPTYTLTAEDLGLDEPAERMSIGDARTWALQAEAGDYLIEYDDDGLTAETDPGSRCGFGDDELAEIERILRDRDLTLRADDTGLCAEAR